MEFPVVGTFLFSTLLYSIDNLFNGVMNEEDRTHHVILTKYGEDIYVDETKVKSNYPDEEGRIENVAVISGNITHEPLTLNQHHIVELRDILNILIQKEDRRL